MTVAFIRTGSAAAPPEHAAAREIASDEVLIRRIAGGDQLAMQTLFARHRVALYRWLLRLVRDEALAEDLLSDVFLDVWRQAAKFEARSSVSTWLLAIARYKTLSARRRRIDAELDEEVSVLSGSGTSRRAPEGAYGSPLLSASVDWGTDKWTPSRHLRALDEWVLKTAGSSVTVDQLYEDLHAT